MRAAHVLVHGRVQGVWFRASTQEEANRLGVHGWVLNTPDGNVEIHMQGPEQAIDALILWCHHGPAGAMVIKVDIDNAPIQQDLQGFTIKY